MFCPVCGIPLDEQAHFCPNCGWRVGGPVKHNVATRAAESFSSTVNKMTGYTDQIDLNFKDFFVAVPQHHTHAEAEALLTCGTPETTPDIATVSDDWPKPWVYSRVFLVLLVTLLMDVILSVSIGNSKGIPTIMFVGSALVPVAALVFFFETNVPRNISFATVLEVLFVGGIASILAIYMNPLGSFSGTVELVPSLITGFVEEVAKALVTAFFLSRMRDKRYILNGILVGAAVGAGFAMFESAGYAFNSYLSYFYEYATNASSYGFSEIDQAVIAAVDGATGSVLARALTALGGHVAWAAAEGGALVLCYDGGEFAWNRLFDKRFLGITALCILFHGLWDSFVSSILIGVVYVVTNNELVSVVIGMLPFIVLIWLVINVLLHRGLAQVNRISRETREAYAAQVQAAQLTPQPPQTPLQ